MVHFVIQWDLPDQKANLTIYANKAKNDWLPITLSHQGVIEIRNYRNPLEVTPHVAITIDFETLDNWRDFIDSADYIRIMRELRILGCRNFTANVWAPVEVFSRVDDAGKEMKRVSRLLKANPLDPMSGVEQSYCRLSRFFPAAPNQGKFCSFSALDFS